MFAVECVLGYIVVCLIFVFFSSRRRHTRCALVTGVQTCALPIFDRLWDLAAETRAEAMAGLADDRRQALIESLRHVKRNLVAAEAGDSGDEPPQKAISNAAGSV